MATGEKNYRPIKDRLLKAVVRVLKSLFDKLGNKNFFSACENCKTKNFNELHHHFAWSMALKDSYTSSLETKLAVELATLIFNKSFFSTLSELCKTLEFHVSERMNKQWKAIDSEGKMKKTLQNRHQIKEQQKKKKKKTRIKRKRKRCFF